MITAMELDQAAQAGKVEFTRVNARPVRCGVQGCRKLMPEGGARRMFVDGHPRGFACAPCQWTVLGTIQRGR